MPFWELLACRPMRKIFFTFLQPLMAVLLLTPVAVSAAEITVTLPPLAGLVTMLDKQAEVMCLLPAGADPHHFQLTPRKIEAMRQSKLLIRAGMDDGGWPLPPHHARSLNLWPDIAHGWLNPVSVRAALPMIAEALITLHPEKSAAIATALNDALAQTANIEQSWHVALAALKTSGVLMQHPAWRGMMHTMGVPVLAVLESARHGHEYGPHKLEHALATLNQHPDAWLLADTRHSTRAIDWLAHHAAKAPRRITLEALGACGLPWTDLMQQNMARLATVAEQVQP